MVNKKLRELYNSTFKEGIVVRAGSKGKYFKNKHWANFVTLDKDAKFDKYVNKSGVFRVMLNGYPTTFDYKNVKVESVSKEKLTEEYNISWDEGGHEYQKAEPDVNVGERSTYFIKGDVNGKWSNFDEDNIEYSVRDELESSYGRGVNIELYMNYKDMEHDEKEDYFKVNFTATVDEDLSD